MKDMTIQRKIALIALLIVTLSLSHASARAAQQGRWVSGSVNNSSSARGYKLWVPAGYGGKFPVPLLLMLHGCTQTPDDFAAGTRMNEIADANRFLVAYPEQPSEANAYKCWNWFLPEHQSRGAGEPALLAAVVEQVRASYRVDAQRVYVAGVSAGAAMAVICGATYPDIFAAIGVHSGLQYKGATNLAEALAAQTKGAGPDPNRQGLLAYQTINGVKSGARKAGIPVIVFHGSLDAAVNPANAEQVVKQWAQTDDYLDDDGDNNTVDDRADATTNGTVAGGYTYTKQIYNDAEGKPLIEKWIVQGMKHAWSGGSAAGSYTDAKGPDASAEMWRFFRSYKLASPRIKRKGAKP
jgi:poly(hydroxyalkanoate) depolymerase family esterase